MTQAEQQRRDRTDAPQTAWPRDAVQIDSTALGLDEVISAIVDLARPAGGRGVVEMTELEHDGDGRQTGTATSRGWPGRRGRPAPTPASRCVAVVGRPNVGKSTLVNRILGSRQAVVEDVPGVTRDRVAYDATWRGRAFTLVDTGGWEPSPGTEEGQSSRALAEQVTAQARVAVDAADAVLFVVDAVVGVTDADDAVAAVLRRSGKPVVVAANKVDDTPGEPAAAALWSLGLGEPLPVSALHGRGSGDLLDAVLDALPEAPQEPFGAEGGPRRIALIGRPNVGKSSLLNKLAGQTRVLVDDVAGHHPGPGGRAHRAGRHHLAVRGHRRDPAAGAARARAPTSTPRCAPPGRWSGPRWRWSWWTPASRSPSRTCGSCPW